MLQTDLYSFSYKKGSLVPLCKRCGAQHFYRNGMTKKGITRYKCRVCGYRFVWTSDLSRRHFFSSIMSFAVELYTTSRIAISLRGIAQILKKAFNVVVSYEAIRQWVIATKKPILRRENSMPTKWHADETYIKIKGVGHYVWIVYCAHTKRILAWHLGKRERTIVDARYVLKTALEVAGVRPLEIVTDGLFQYAAAIKKVMGWHWRVYRKRHTVDSGIGKNALIERLNREIKRRIKYFSTFQSLEGANAFFGLWCYHHNQNFSTPST